MQNKKTIRKRKCESTVCTKKTEHDSFFRSRIVLIVLMFVWAHFLSQQRRKIFQRPLLSNHKERYPQLQTCLINHGRYYPGPELSIIISHAIITPRVQNPMKRGKGKYQCQDLRGKY